MTTKEIQEIRSLGQKKFRDQLGLFVVEGEKMVGEAQKSGWKVEKVIRREEVGDSVMSRLSGLSSPSPVLAVVRKPLPRKVDAPFEGVSLALDSVRDPGNIGTIIRIADWFGVKAVYASKDCAELFNPKVIQASMGSVFRVPFISCDLCALADSFAEAGSGVYGTFLGGENIYEAPLEKNALVFMGNEANGISQDVAARLQHRLTIPSFGTGAESLNVAVATAITMSEWRRR